MNIPASDNRYKNRRFPAEIISHGVWLYYRFCLSYRDVEELLFVRGIVVTYEAVRKWCRKFGQAYANQLRRRRSCPGDKWHLDEVFLTINGDRHYLWRAVAQDGTVLDILVQRRRDKKAAKKFFRKLLKGCQYVPRVIVTDKLKSYGAAKREILPGVEHRQHRYLNNRAEKSHQPTRQRERRMQGFRSPGHAPPDATLQELCTQLATTQQVTVSQATISRALTKLGLPRKKNVSRRRARTTGRPTSTDDMPRHRHAARP